MGDPMMKMGAGGPPPGGPSPVMKNMSALNPVDAATMASSGNFTPDMTVRDYFQKMGIDVDGPVTQLVEFAKKQSQNANPMNKMRNIAADTALQKGGTPQPMTGPKPMVAPPGQPAPSGLSGLMQKLGG
jgi:hypothetical protein